MNRSESRVCGCVCGCCDTHMGGSPALAAACAGFGSLSAAPRWSRWACRSCARCAPPPARASCGSLRVRVTKPVCVTVRGGLPRVWLHVCPTGSPSEKQSQITRQRERHTPCMCLSKRDLHAAEPSAPPDPCSHAWPFPCAITSFSLAGFPEPGLVRRRGLALECPPVYHA